jgi:hypothetical protein
MGRFPKVIMSNPERPARPTSTHPVDIVSEIIVDTLPSSGIGVELRDGKPYLPVFVEALRDRLHGECVVWDRSLECEPRDAYVIAYTLASVMQIDLGGVSYMLRDIVDLRGLLAYPVMAVKTSLKGR